MFHTYFLECGKLEAQSLVSDRRTHQSKTTQYQCYRALGIAALPVPCESKRKKCDKQSAFFFFSVPIRVCAYTMRRNNRNQLRAINIMKNVVFCNIKPSLYLTKQTPWLLVRERTIPTDRPPLVDKI
jgi:hypothetical protein